MLLVLRSAKSVLCQPYNNADKSSPGAPFASSELACPPTPWPRFTPRCSVAATSDVDVLTTEDGEGGAPAPGSDVDLRPLPRRRCVVVPSLDPPVLGILVRPCCPRPRPTFPALRLLLLLLAWLLGLLLLDATAAAAAAGWSSSASPRRMDGPEEEDPKSNDRVDDGSPPPRIGLFGDGLDFLVHVVLVCGCCVGARRDTRTCASMCGAIVFGRLIACRTMWLTAGLDAIDRSDVAW